MDDQEPTRPLNLPSSQGQPTRPDSSLVRPGMPASSSQVSAEATQHISPTLAPRQEPYSDPRLPASQSTFAPRVGPEEHETTFRNVGPPQLPPFSRMRGFLDSRAGRITVPLVALCLGLILGLSALLWYGLSGEGPVVIVPASGQGNLVIEAGAAFVTQLVSQDLAHSGLPGSVQNVHVALGQGASMVITGDDVYSLVVTTFSRHFTVDVQPYVQSCFLQMRVTHADIGSIPVTTFIQSFENNINTQLAKKPSGLPDGFTYCAVGTRTEPAGLFITYQATPTQG